MNDGRTIQLDELHTRLANAWGAKAPNVDEILNSCTAEGGECSTCSIIICPHADPMHFHHDGCPSCAEEVES